MSKVDDIIDDIFMRGLPSTNYLEIAVKVGVSAGLVNNAINAVRSDPEKYGWTIPHIKRGPAGLKDGDRLYAVLVEADGKYDFNYAEQGVHLIAGLISTASLIATQSRNEAQALRMAADYCKPVERRRTYRLAAILDVVESQAQQLVDELKAA